MSDSLFVSAEQMAVADNYNDWTFSLFEGCLKGSVLEVGSGVGSFTRHMLQYKIDCLLSIDVSEDAVERCRKNIRHPRVKFQCVDIRQLTGEFDTVICMNVLEHIGDDRNTLKHMLDLLRPGGVLFLLVPAHQWLFSPFDREAGHYRRYSKRHMRGLLREVSDVPLDVEQFYFNGIGALGYFTVYTFFRKKPKSGAVKEIGFFDRRVVPVMRRIEGRRWPIGLSLVSIISKP